MSVIRVNKTSDYTVISNYHFKEKKMSLKAKGLLSLMLSLPEGWDYSIAGLAALSSDGEASVRKGLNELEEFGYLVRKRIYQDGKIVDWEYEIYEMPQGENLDVENQQVGFQVVEKQDNKILNKQIRKKVNTKNSKVNTVALIRSNPKENLYSKSVALINNFTDSPKIRKALQAFLDLQLEIYRDNGKTFYINTWKNRLNKLKNEFDEREWYDVINYAVDKGWQNFYPIPTNNKKDAKRGKAWEEKVVSVSITDAEREAEEAEADKLEAMGIKARF